MARRESILDLLAWLGRARHGPTPSIPPVRVIIWSRALQRAGSVSLPPIDRSHLREGDIARPLQCSDLEVLWIGLIMPQPRPAHTR